MKWFRVISIGCSLILMCLVTQISYAKKAFDKTDPIFMIEACKEVMEIYKARDEKRFMASQRTSLAEAMRAGYCIGALQQMNCRNRHSTNHWMKAAQLIAQLDVNLRDNQILKPFDILAHGACQ